MLSQLFFRLRRISRRLWIRAALISALALVASAASPLLGPVLPEQFRDFADERRLRGLLDILANSMLAVTTFSLTIMVTAHFYAAQNLTPRAHRFLRQDTRTQTVLATFVGAFVFALASIVLIDTGIHGSKEFGVVYLFTLVVFGTVILAILRWINHLSGLGSHETTGAEIEEMASRTIRARMEAPFLGGHALRDSGQIPERASAVSSDRSGFVRHVDALALSETASAAGGSFYLSVPPGDWVHEGDPLGFTDAEFDSAIEEALRSSVTIGDLRSTDQDIEFALTILTEIAERALSPGINDPKTATEMTGRLLRLSQQLSETEVEEPEAPAFHAPPINVFRVVEAAFTPIARDGKAFVEVQIAVQRALSALSRSPNGDLAEAARIASRRALAYAEAGLPLDEDIARVREIAPADGAAPRRAVGDEADVAALASDQET